MYRCIYIVDDENYSGMIKTNDYIHMYRGAIQIFELDFIGNEASNVSLEADFPCFFFSFLLLVFPSVNE